MVDLGVNYQQDGEEVQEEEFFCKDLKKPRELAASNKRGSFFGHFTYALYSEFESG